MGDRQHALMKETRKTLRFYQVQLYKIMDERVPDGLFTPCVSKRMLVDDIIRVESVIAERNAK